MPFPLPRMEPAREIEGRRLDAITSTLGKATIATRWGGPESHCGERAQRKVRSPDGLVGFAGKR